MSDKKSIRRHLTAATCALVGLNAHTPVAASEFDTSLLLYTEPVGRLNVFESATRVRQTLGGGKILTTRLVVDVMTGASPNGATRSDRPQTFTRPSGRGSYTVGAGNTPLDDTFQDNRVGLDVDIEIPIGRLVRTSLGGHGSVEYDYISLGANGSIARDFNKRNTSLMAALAVAQDYIDPEGGPPIPFASMTPPRTLPPRQADGKDKIIVDVLAGVTQVVSRRTRVDVNYSLSHASGYLTDPFKLLSVVEGAPGPNQGESLDYVFEHRPESRTKHSIYTAVKHHLARDVVEGSYRYLWDDWGIRSHTMEIRYRRELVGRSYVQPQFRYYHQGAASFYRHSLVDGARQPDFASADYRLGKFDGITVALKYGFQRPNGHRVNIRLGYYAQMGDSSPPDAIGVLRSHDLFETVRAVTTQVSYGFSW